ncbi:MAG: CDP-2,3-bis-(O-geranylgeranyl)-sn-glycerol synthase [Candidatus Aenigmarchaeota archaeon]|nr:CDP-2,3-bis-(O-geranylgeranyl)-sn-glycerol synthase [Candidatus Aenigmarchaeota archaeon]
MVWDILGGIFTIEHLVEAFWLVLPAYAANGLVPLFGGKHRADFGKNFIDGEPFLGSGKTLEGFFFGTLVGALIATVQMLAFPYLPWGLSEVPLNIVAMSPVLGVLLGLGAMTGDSAGSFIKRRLKLKRGAAAPGIDQLDFLFGAFLFALILVKIELSWVVLMAIVTPIVHITASFLGFRLRLKREPW